MIPSVLSKQTDAYDDEDESRSFNALWWDTKQKLAEIPRLATALFVKPNHEGIQCTADLVYEYGQAVKHIPSLLRRLAFKTRTLEEELQEAMLRGNLRKAFHGFDLLMIGLGIVIGTGAFSLTGEAQAKYAGSATIVSYAIAGLACTFAATCFAELCVEYPVSGSAFTYVMVTFGEYPAYITMGMLFVEYVLGMAAVARGFSQFLAQLVNQPYTLFVFDDNNMRIDVMAFVVVIAMSAILSFGVRESALFLNATTLLKLFLIAFVCIAGYVKADGALFTNNFTLPGKGVDGIFQGTACIFFAYVAFDAVCNAVEETQRPNRIPKAIIGTVIVSTIVYMAMSSSLSLIIDPETLMLCSSDMGDLLTEQPTNCVYPNTVAYNLAYIVAFNSVNLQFMQYIVAFAALLGITTSLFVGLFSVARLVMVASRTWLLPPPLARISPRTQTPIIAQMTLGFIIATIALLGRFNILSDLVSLGALFSMWMVCNVVLFRRYFPQVKFRYTSHGTVEAEYSQTLWWMPGSLLSRPVRRMAVRVHIVLINLLSLGLVIFDRLTLDECQLMHQSSNGEYVDCLDSVAASGLGRQLNPWTGAWVVAWGFTTISMFLMCPMEYQPKEWAIKWYLLPFMPSFAILLICFSAGSMKAHVYTYLLTYLIILTALYVVFSMPMSYIRHFTVGPSYSEQLTVVELVEQDGQYVQWNDLQAYNSAAARKASSSMTFTGTPRFFGSSQNVSGFDSSGKGGSAFDSGIPNSPTSTATTTTTTEEGSSHGGNSNTSGSRLQFVGIARITSRGSGAPSLPVLEEGDHEDHHSE